MDVDNIKNLREWSPLSDLLSKIPTRIQKTFFYQDVNITCIDVLPDFIALGSDVGIVFWYNRSTGDVQKLRSEVIEEFSQFINYRKAEDDVSLLVV